MSSDWCRLRWSSRSYCGTIESELLTYHANQSNASRARRVKCTRLRATILLLGLAGNDGRIDGDFTLKRGEDGSAVPRCVARYTGAVAFDERKGKYMQRNSAVYGRNSTRSRGSSIDYRWYPIALVWPLWELIAQMQCGFNSISLHLAHDHHNHLYYCSSHRPVDSLHIHHAHPGSRSDLDSGFD